MHDALLLEKWAEGFDLHCKLVGVESDQLIELIASFDKEAQSADGSLLRGMESLGAQAQHFSPDNIKATLGGIKNLAADKWDKLPLDARTKKLIPYLGSAGAVSGGLYGLARAPDRDRGETRLGNMMTGGLAMGAAGVGLGGLYEGATRLGAHQTEMAKIQNTAAKERLDALIANRRPPRKGHSRSAWDMWGRHKDWQNWRARAAVPKNKRGWWDIHGGLADTRERMEDRWDLLRHRNPRHYR